MKLLCSCARSIVKVRHISKQHQHVALILITLVGQHVLPLEAVETGCVSPPADIVGWWPAEDNAGDPVGGNDGVLLNGITFTNGRVGQGLNSSACVNIRPAIRAAGSTPEPALDTSNRSLSTSFNKSAWSMWA